MSGALDFSQYRIDDIVERIEREIKQATCERPPLVTEQGVCVKRKIGKGHYSTPPWMFCFRAFESAEKYFREHGYKEVGRSEENGERKLVMLDPALDETYEIDYDYSENTFHKRLKEELEKLDKEEEK